MIKRKVGFGFLFGLLCILGVAASCCTLSVGLAVAAEPASSESSSESTREKVLEFFVTWNVEDGEILSQALSKREIIERIPKPEDYDSALQRIHGEKPEGMIFWFKGVNPGDVILGFTVRSKDDWVVYTERYTIRVHDDLTLEVLSEKVEDMRERFKGKD